MAFCSWLAELFVGSPTPVDALTQEIHHPTDEANSILRLIQTTKWVGRRKLRRRVWSLSKELKANRVPDRELKHVEMELGIHVLRGRFRVEADPCWQRAVERVSQQVVGLEHLWSALESRINEDTTCKPRMATHRKSDLAKLGRAVSRIRDFLRKHPPLPRVQSKPHTLDELPSGKEVFLKEPSMSVMEAIRNASANALHYQHSGGIRFIRTHGSVVGIWVRAFPRNTTSRAFLQMFCTFEDHAAECEACILGRYRVFENTVQGGFDVVFTERR